MSSKTFASGLGTKIQSQIEPDAATDRMVNAIEQIRLVEKYRNAFEKLEKGSSDVPAFLRHLAPEMIMGLLKTLDHEDASMRLKTAIQQDLLDRAGYGKITKALNVTATVDHTTSKRELVNMIFTKAKKAGIKTRRKDEDEGGGGSDGGDVVDVDAVVQSEPSEAGSSGNSDEIRGEANELASYYRPDSAGDV